MMCRTLLQNPLNLKISNYIQINWTSSFFWIQFHRCEWSEKQISRIPWSGIHDIITYSLSHGIPLKYRIDFIQRSQPCKLMGQKFSKPRFAFMNSQSTVRSPYHISLIQPSIKNIMSHRKVLLLALKAQSSRNICTTGKRPKSFADIQKELVFSLSF